MNGNSAILFYITESDGSNYPNDVFSTTGNNSTGVYLASNVLKLDGTQIGTYTNSGGRSGVAAIQA